MNIVAANDGEPLFGVVLMSLFAMAAFACVVWRSGRKKFLLKQWEKRSGVRRIEYEERLLLRCPFFFSTGKSRVVYRVTVEYPDGRCATGWLRFGGALIGLWSDAREQRWDNAKQEPCRPGFPVILKNDTPNHSGEAR